jgi:isopenicillin N synthase-like dioxygenase
MGKPYGEVFDAKEGVPVIDASGLLRQEGTGNWPPTYIVDQIRDACTRWGFFQLVNHGLPLDVLHLLDEESKR